VLKRGAVPSVSLPEEDDDTDDVDAISTPVKKMKKEETADEACLDRSVSPEPVAPLQRFESDLGVDEMPPESNTSDAHDFSDKAVEESVMCEPTPKVKVHSVYSQTTGRLAPYTIRDFMFRPEELNDLTGIPSYDRFMLILQSLGPDVNNIKYRNFPVRNVSVEDQFFMVLWKLRKAATDIELGCHFEVCRTTAGNIVSFFIKFAADQWGKLEIFPSRDLVDYYMPEGFKKTYPSTRVIVDGTEIPIDKPKNPIAQQATFSTYKNCNTLKVLVGGSPSGLISYVSEAYGGSTSDRQIVERSNLLDICERNDSVMADRGFNVQDIFAPKGVAVNIPAFLKGNHLRGVTIMNDRKLASKRVHIERLIGLTKGYKILRTKLNNNYVPIGSEVTLY